MISTNEDEYENYKIMILFYETAFNKLLELHKKPPSVIEVCMYLVTTTNEDLKDILELAKEINKKD